MKESIGVKGDHNDRKRVLLITKKQKKKLEKYYNESRIKELEKKVRKGQIINLLTAVPLVISINVFKTFMKNCENITKEDNIKKKEENNLSNIKIKSSNELYNKEDKENFVIKEEIYVTDEVGDLPIVIIPIDTLDKSVAKEDKKDTILVTNNGIDKKIIEEYTNELKKVRTELKDLIYDKNFYIESKKDNKNEAEQILNNLKIIIKKLDELNNIIKKSDMGDENYYYNLALEYINEFNNGKTIENIKDSPLYIEISKKLKELDYKKEDLKDSILSKKVTNYSMENNDFFDFLDFNKDIEVFQEKQEQIIKKLEQSNTKDIERKQNNYKKTEIEEESKNNYITSNINNNIESAINKAKELNNYCQSLIETINKPTMKKPSIRSTKAVAVTTLIAAYFMRKVLRNKFKTRRKKKIIRNDYNIEIETNISDIDNVLLLIKESKSKIDSIINEIISEYYNYLYLKEFQDLLTNLDNIRSEIIEKEYEVDNIRSRHMDSINNQKIK